MPREVLGEAKRKIPVTAVCTNNEICCPVVIDKMRNTINDENNDVASKGSTSLKNLSLSEIIKLAENRADLAETGRGHATDHYLRHKRMVVSDNITRRQATSASGENKRLTDTDDQLIDNEQFFDNLMTKMVAEQFVPRAGMKKTMRLWNKENSNAFRKRRQREDNSFADKSVHRSSSSGVAKSVTASLFGNQAADNCASTWTRKLDSLRRNLTQHSNEAIPNDLDCGETSYGYPVKFWNSPSTSRVAEYYEPVVSADCESTPTFDLPDMEQNITPLPTTKLGKCEACISERKEYKYRYDTFGQLPPLPTYNSPDDMLL